MAKELYQREIRSNPERRGLTGCTMRTKLQTCECQNCTRRKRSEHMRWNAYTRAIGYSFQKDHKADRAKLHNSLQEWEKLSVRDKQKD